MGQGLGARGGAISLGSTSPLEARGRHVSGSQSVSQSVSGQLTGQLVNRSVSQSISQSRSVSGRSRTAYRAGVPSP